MRTKTVVKRVSMMTPGEYERCRRLNFRDNGLMQDDLRRLRTWEKKRDARVVMIFSEFGRLISWSLMEPRYDGGYSAMFYTRVSERGKGYGKRMMRQVMKFDQNPHVYPHDDRSAGFFQAYDDHIRVSSIDSHWLTKEVK